MGRLGLKPDFIDGQRITDENTLEIAEMVLCGKVGKELVKLMILEGGRSVSISGKDGGLVRAQKRLHVTEENGATIEIDLGQVGDVVAIDTSLLEILLGHGYVPVVAPIAIGGDGKDYNINADILAGEMASALQAEQLVMMTDVDGVSTDMHRPDKLISRMQASKAKDLLGTTIRGGMIPKVTACIKALDMGLKKAHIINGTSPHSLLRTLLTEEQIGTILSHDDPISKRGVKA
jgi:acetylglutamate kinase